MKHWLSQFKPWALVVYRPSGALEVPCWTRRSAYLQMRQWKDIAQGTNAEVYVERRRRRRRSTEHNGPVAFCAEDGSMWFYVDGVWYSEPPEGWRRVLRSAPGDTTTWENQ